MRELFLDIMSKAKDNKVPVSLIEKELGLSNGYLGKIQKDETRSLSPDVMEKLELLAKSKSFYPDSVTNSNEVTESNVVTKSNLVTKSNNELVPPVAPSPKVISRANHGAWGEYLSRFHELQAQPLTAEVRQKLEQIKSEASTDSSLTYRQMDGIVERVNNVFNGSYGRTKQGVVYKGA